jgi:membrane protein DedA with SNARE-associated domain
VAKKPAVTPPPPPVSRAQRVLGYVVASVIGLAILSIAALLIGAATNQNTSVGMWQVVNFIPLLALPIGLILVLVLLGITFARRSRAAKDAGK